MKIDKSYYLVSTTITTFSISNLEKKKERKPFSLCFFFFFEKMVKKVTTVQGNSEHNIRENSIFETGPHIMIHSTRNILCHRRHLYEFLLQIKIERGEKKSEKNTKKRIGGISPKEKKKKYKILLGNFRTSKNLLRPDFFFSK